MDSVLSAIGLDDNSNELAIRGYLLELHAMRRVAATPRYYGKPGVHLGNSGSLEGSIR